MYKKKELEWITGERGNKLHVMAQVMKATPGHVDKLSVLKVLARYLTPDSPATNPLR